MPTHQYVVFLAGTVAYRSVDTINNGIRGVSCNAVITKCHSDIMRW